MDTAQLDQYRLALDYVEAGHLDAAHKIAQRYEGDGLADTIHAIVHRREGDYSNSNYWWRRVGTNIPADLLSLYGDPIAFTNQVRDGSDPSGASEIAAREISTLRTVLASLGDGK